MTIFDDRMTPTDAEFRDAVELARDLLEPYLAGDDGDVEVAMEALSRWLDGQGMWTPDPRVWAVHNLFGHPAMAVLQLIGCRRAGEWIHDVTEPRK